MAKELAIIMGGKRIAILIAILATFAVLATMGDQLVQSRDRSPPPSLAVVNDAETHWVFAVDDRLTAVLDDVEQVASGYLYGTGVPAQLIVANISDADCRQEGSNDLLVAIALFSETNPEVRLTTLFFQANLSDNPSLKDQTGKSAVTQLTRAVIFAVFDRNSVFGPDFIDPEGLAKGTFAPNGATLRTVDYSFHLSPQNVGGDTAAPAAMRQSSVLSPLRVTDTLAS